MLENPPDVFKLESRRRCKSAEVSSIASPRRVNVGFGVFSFLFGRFDSARKGRQEGPRSLIIDPQQT